MPESSIAIVGAGLSGLVCARILQRSGTPATVYEADATPDARQQGGSLDIHDDTGQVALKEAGLHEQFLARTHPGGEDVRLLDKNGRVYLARREPAGGAGGPGGGLAGLLGRPLGGGVGLRASRGGCGVVLV